MAAPAGLACADARPVALQLFVTGASPRSLRAIQNVRALCERHLGGRVELEIVDLARDPARVRAEQLVAAPTLVRRWPLPVRRFVGDLSQTEQLIRQLVVPGLLP